MLVVEKRLAKNAYGVSETFRRLTKPSLLIEGLDGFFFVLVNVEDLVQLHQLEHFRHVRTDIGQFQVDSVLFAFLAQQNKFANHRGGHERDRLKIQYHFALRMGRFFYQLLAELLDSSVVQNLGFGETDDQDAFVFPRL